MLVVRPPHVALQRPHTFCPCGEGLADGLKSAQTPPQVFDPSLNPLWARARRTSIQRHAPRQSQKSGHWERQAAQRRASKRNRRPRHPSESSSMASMTIPISWFKSVRRHRTQTCTPLVARCASTSSPGKTRNSFGTRRTGVLAGVMEPARGTRGAGAEGHVGVDGGQ